MEDYSSIKFDGIRRQWDQEAGKWWFSIVDVIALTTKSTDPRNYWKVLKNRLGKAQNKLVTECNQLKMLANDGKFYFTDVADEQTTLNIVKLVAETHTLPLRRWMDTLDAQNLPPVPISQGRSLRGEANEASYPQLNDEIGNEDMMIMVDGYQDNDMIVMQAFLAGAEIENILISVTCDSVTIKGERKTTKNIKDEDYVAQELSWGKFSRTIPLPEEIEVNQSEVTERNGLITIKLPMIDKTHSKLLKIKTIQ